MSNKKTLFKEVETSELNASWCSRVLLKKGPVVLFLI